LLGIPVRHLRWIPHSLPADQTEVGCDLSEELLRVLRRQEAKSWPGIVTLDESWFSLSTVSSKSGSPRELSMRESQSMLTIVWNSCGQKFNATYYVSHMAQAILDCGRTQVSSSNRKLTVHADPSGPSTAHAFSLQLAGRNRLHVGHELRLLHLLSALHKCTSFVRSHRAEVRTATFSSSPVRDVFLSALPSIDQQRSAEGLLNGDDDHPADELSTRWRPEAAASPQPASPIRPPDSRALSAARDPLLPVEEVIREIPGIRGIQNVFRCVRSRPESDRFRSLSSEFHRRR
jgi:hypothetical protein